MDAMRQPFFVVCMIVFCSVLISTSGHSMSASLKQDTGIDYDPLVDVSVTFTLLSIRALDTIEVFSEPSFFVVVSMNNKTYSSQVWPETSYVYTSWSIQADVPDDHENVEVIIQLWDHLETGDRLCDICEEENGGDEGYAVHLTYSIKTGRWTGDDSYIGDPNGYGRVSGYGDENSVDTDYDCELWFRLSQNDYDHDNVPYWVETTVYGTDPTMNNTGEDDDQDGVPFEWEHRWGFHPFIWDDHASLDPDDDSLTNIEEFLTAGFGSDPFRKDVFLELDFMQESPDGISSQVPCEALELLKNPFHMRNIVMHVDTGEFKGGDSIPYQDDVTFSEAVELYRQYFLGDQGYTWKRSVFHYGMIVYSCTPKGYGFSADETPHIDYLPGTNAFIISSKQMEKNAKLSLSKDVSYFYGSAIMHELGHNFGLRLGHPFGVDAQSTKKPWRFGYWFYGDYKSIMNYRYTYKIFDYSDGSHGKRDFNDWAALDFSHFEEPEG